MSNVIIINTEDDEKAVIEMIKKAKGKKLLVAIHSLEDDDTPVSFEPKHKSECIGMLEMSKTIAAVMKEVTGMRSDIGNLRNGIGNLVSEITQLKLYDEYQKDLKKLKHIGHEKTILFPINDA